MNTLYYGDNLDIMRRYIKDESVDLSYLDPPFNSNATYNVLFSDRDGNQTAAQLQAFKDTWSWAEASPIYQSLILEPGTVGTALRAFGDLLPKGGLLAYLVMMAPRLAELRRVLKPTGSIYLHCDPTASHYLKVLMDAIFGPQAYRNEIIWKRTSAHNDPGRYGANIDCLLFYKKGVLGPGIRSTWHTTKSILRGSATKIPTGDFGLTIICQQKDCQVAAMNTNTKACGLYGGARL